MSTTRSAAAHQYANAPAGPTHGPVLLATDGRTRTDAPAVAARLLAERLGAPVHVLAVLVPLPAYTYEAPVLPPGYEAERKYEVAARVRTRLAPVLGAPERWTLETGYGSPARVIADVAREREAALIVVGTGGHRAIDRLFGEEVSLQVVRHASTPVLAVAPELAAPIRRAVVAVDFSAASVRAAETALALLDAGADAPAQLTLVHVRSPVEDRLPIPLAWAAEYDASVGAMFARLRDLLRPHARPDVTIETRVRTGPVVDRLLEAADEVGAELVAVGTQGPGWVERLLVGSVATETLRRAGRTVLVAPAPAPADRVRLELRIIGQVSLADATDWAGALDAFTRRNAGRRARLEVSGPAGAGFVAGGDGYRFDGAAFDRHDGRIEVMMSAGDGGAARLTHSVTRARLLQLVADEAERDRALLVEDARGHTVLTFAD
jgi:nucleotide-binding universal stress UspA family protein